MAKIYNALLRNCIASQIENMLKKNQKKLPVEYTYDLPKFNYPSNS